MKAQIHIVGKILAALLLIAAVVTGIDFVFGKVVNKTVFAREGTFIHETFTGRAPQCDVLILGSSRAIHHYDDGLLADSLGLNVINTGVQGVNSIFEYALLKEVLDSSNVRFVVVDLLPNEFYPKKRMVSEKNLIPYCGVSDAVKEILKEDDNSNKMAVYSYLLSMNSSIHKLRHNRQEHYFAGLQALENPPLEFGKKYETERDAFSVECLKNLFSLAKEKSVEIIAVVSPSVSVFDSTTEGMEICDSLGVPLYDFSHWEGVHEHPEKYFVDNTHMNLTGAHEFTLAMLPILRKHIAEL